MGKRHVESYTNRYLDAVLARLQLPSDYALASVLGVSTQAIYKMRGGGVMSTTTAARIAELLEVDPMKVIAEVELERGTDDELWKRIARKVAVVGLVAIGGVIVPPPSAGHAAPLNPQLCIMLSRLRRVGAWLSGLPGFADDELVA